MVPNLPQVSWHFKHLGHILNKYNLTINRSVTLTVCLPKSGLHRLCGGVHIAQRQITTRIPIGFCVPVLGLSVGLRQCRWTITMLMVQRHCNELRPRSRFYKLWDVCMFCKIFSFNHKSPNMCVRFVNELDEVPHVLIDCILVA